MAKLPIPAKWQILLTVLPLTGLYGQSHPFQYNSKSSVDADLSVLGALRDRLQPTLTA